MIARKSTRSQELFTHEKRQENWLRSEPQLLYLVPSTSRCFVNSRIPEFIVSGKNPKEVLNSANLHITNEYGANFLPQKSYLCTGRGAEREPGRLCGLEGGGGGRRQEEEAWVSKVPLKKSVA